MIHSSVRWRNQLILAIGLFGLGTAAYWLQFKHEPSREAAEGTARKVFELKDTPVTQIEIQNGPIVTVLRCLDDPTKLCKPLDSSKWEVTQSKKGGTSITLRADDSGANSLLSSLNNLQVQDKISLKEESTEKRTALFKDYGLSESDRSSIDARRIKVTTPTGERSLVLGIAHPLGGTFFAGVENGNVLDAESVLLIPTFFKSNFERDLTYWRNKKLLTLQAAEVSSFTLKGSHGSIRGSRDAQAGSAPWTLTLPGDTVAGDTDNIDALLAAVTYLMAVDFPVAKKTTPEAKALLSKTRASLSLTLEATQDRKQTLVLHSETAGKAKKLYATVSDLDPIYELDPSTLARLDKKPQELRLSKLLTSADRFTATQLSFSHVKDAKAGSAPRLSLTQTAGKWVAADGAKKVNSEKIQVVLDRLSGNRIRDFVSSAKAPGGEDSGFELKLGDAQTPVKRHLRIWKAGDRLCARDLLSKRNEVLMIDPTIIDALPWDLATLETEGKP